jgi:molecular chaperone DnaJ
MDDGMRMRVQGKGNAPLEGHGQDGDLILELRVQPDKVFKRSGSKILTTVDVPLQVAILGGSVRVPTIDGEVELKIPPGTQPNDEKLLRKRGVKEVNRTARGDQVVTLNVVLPKQLTDKQKELLREAFNLKEQDKEHKEEEKETEKETIFSKFFKK